MLFPNEGVLLFLAQLMISLNRNCGGHLEDWELSICRNVAVAVAEAAAAAVVVVTKCIVRSVYILYIYIYLSIYLKQRALNHVMKVLHSKKPPLISLHLGYEKNQPTTKEERHQRVLKSSKWSCILQHLQMCQTSTPSGNRFFSYKKTLGILPFRRLQ